MKNILNKIALFCAATLFSLPLAAQGVGSLTGLSLTVSGAVTSATITTGAVTSTGNFDTSGNVSAAVLGSHGTAQDIIFMSSTGTLAKIPSVASPVNIINLVASATGVTTAITSSGSDTNIPITINAQGSGPINLVDPEVLTGTLTQSGNHIFSVAASGVVFKQGANGKVGTFICTSGGDITVANTSVAITDVVIPSLNTVGGTISTVPAVKSITASTGFHMLCPTGDTSTYNYAILSNAS